MKRLSPEDRERLIGCLIDDDIQSIRNDGSSSVASVFRFGFPGYVNMPDAALLEMAEEKSVLEDVDVVVIETDEEYRDYFVSWEIDVTAPTPQDAAQQARYAQRPGTTATVFDVFEGDDENGIKHLIDLSEEPQPEEK